MEESTEKNAVFSRSYKKKGRYIKDNKEVSTGKASLS